MILSSSPKLNFFIKIPVPMATAAAGVESLIIHSLILVNPLFIVFINFGSLAAKVKLQNNVAIIKVIKIIFLNIILTFLNKEALSMRLEVIKNIDVKVLEKRGIFFVF